MHSSSKSLIESVAHLAVVALIAMSVTSNAILVFGRPGISFSQVTGVFLLFSISSWLGLAVLSIVLNITGSDHHRFSFRCMLVALIGMILSGFAFPAVT